MDEATKQALINAWNVLFDDAARLAGLGRNAEAKVMLNACSDITYAVRGLNGARTPPKPT